MTGSILPSSSTVPNAIPAVDLQSVNQNVQKLVKTVATVAAAQIANNNQIGHTNRIIKLFGMISIGTAIGTLVNTYIAMNQEAKINNIGDRIAALENNKQIKNKGE